MKRLIILLTLLTLILAGCGSTETPTAEPVEALPTEISPTAVPEPTVTEEPTPASLYSTILDLEFDEPGDADWFDKGAEREITNEEIIADSSLRIGDGIPLQFVKLRPGLAPGSLVHFQFRISSDACFPIDLRMEKEGDDGESLFRLSGCSMNEMGLNAVRNVPDSESTQGMLSLSNSVLANPDTWTDVIFWLHPDGDKLFYLIGQDEQLSYGSVTIPEDWQTDTASLMVQSWFDNETQHLDINSLRVAEGSLKDYLAENLSAYQPVQSDVDSFLESEPQAFPELAAPEPEEISQDPFGFINQWLMDWEVVFGENVEAMRENEGGQFGSGAMKTYNAEENVFVFSEMDGMIWTPLNTHLDEFGGMETGGNQAIMIKFQPSTASALYFTFMGPNEFGVNFWNDGHPSTFFFVEASEESFEGDFFLQDGIWYNMLMAIDRDGSFLSVVWEDGNYDNHAEYRVNLSERDMGEGYKNVSWKFIIGSQGPLTLNTAEYNIFNFESFSE